MFDIYTEIVKLISSGSHGVVITVIEKEGHGPAQLQAKLLVTAAGQRFGTIGGGELERIALNSAKDVLSNRQSQLQSYSLTTEHEILPNKPTGMICGGSVTLFYEYIGVSERVVIFGAGHIGRSLVYHLRNLKYHITVVDDREEQLAQVEGANEKIHSSFESFFENMSISECDFVVISTYSHEVDYQVLRAVYQSIWQPRYIGMIASHVKKTLILEGLPAEVREKIDLSKLYSPCGLYIGGATPDEIAVSVSAEMQAIRYGKEGHMHMRDKKPMQK